MYSRHKAEQYFWMASGPQTSLHWKSVADVSSWAQEDLWNPLTVKPQKSKRKLLCATENIYKQTPDTAQSHLSKAEILFWKSGTAHPLGQRRTGPSGMLASHDSKTSNFDVKRLHSMGNLHICDGAVDTELQTQVWEWSHILCCNPDDIVFREGLV